MKIPADAYGNSIVRTFKDGLKWVSSSEFKLPLVSLMGVAGFVLALKDSKIRGFCSFPLLPQNQESSEKLFRVPGLQNLGNTCFLNVILQALASSQSFQSCLEKVIDECEFLGDVERVESLPLTVALATLLKDLSAVSSGKVVLSPRNVMRAMVLYIPNFNITSQQDAAEAFLHLLSSLREEFSECYRPSPISLVDTSSNYRILAPNGRKDQNEQERWRENFLCSFDGILGSILTCQSCSSQISLDFEFFHSLPLPPLSYGGATFLQGCTLEDLMKKFFAAEQLENYKCSHCWHIAAIKYLSVVGDDKTEIEKLKRCTEQDSCDCRSLIQLENLPWSNKFSKALKQLSIACSPKILCIHLQRASVNMFGEVVKLQGHVSFPLIWDVSPFLTSEVGVKNLDENMQRGITMNQYQRHSPLLNHLHMQLDMRRPNCTSATMDKALAADEFSCAENVPPFQAEPNEFSPECSYNSMHPGQFVESDEKGSLPCHLISSPSHMYRLVSVVAHSGGTEFGHYTIYRSARSEPRKDPSEEFEQGHTHWFCISDSEVINVSEEDVLSAEASLLFYERILCR